MRGCTGTVSISSPVDAESARLSQPTSVVHHKTTPTIIKEIFLQACDLHFPGEDSHPYMSLHAPGGCDWAGGRDEVNADYLPTSTYLPPTQSIISIAVDLMYLHWILLGCEPVLCPLWTGCDTLPPLSGEPSRTIDTTSPNYYVHSGLMRRYSLVSPTCEFNHTPS